MLQTFLQNAAHHSYSRNYGTKFFKVDIDEAAWVTFSSTAGRPFLTLRNGRFAVKVINHFGDEVMVFRLAA